MAWVLPKTVTVGHLDIAVKPLSKEEATKIDQSGYFEGDTCEIAVLETLSPARQAEVFMHEMFHACYFLGQIKARTAEETTCDAFAMALAGVIRHNPGLFQKLEKALAKPEPTE